MTRQRRPAIVMWAVAASAAAPVGALLVTAFYALFFGTTIAQGDQGVSGLVLLLAGAVACWGAVCAAPIVMLWCGLRTGQVLVVVVNVVSLCLEYGMFVDVLTGLAWQDAEPGLSEAESTVQYLAGGLSFVGQALGTVLTLLPNTSRWISARRTVRSRTR